MSKRIKRTLQNARLSTTANLITFTCLVTAGLGVGGGGGLECLEEVCLLTGYELFTHQE